MPTTSKLPATMKKPISHQMAGCTSVLLDDWLWDIHRATVGTGTGG